MKCPNCNGEIPIGQRYCAVCGKKVEVDFDFISESVAVDASAKRGRQFEEGMKFCLAVLVLLLTLAYLYNSYRSVVPIADAEAHIPAPPAPTDESDVTVPSLDPLEGLPKPKIDIPATGLVGAKRYGYRLGRTKARLIEARGGDVQTKEAVDKGLRYLAHAQHRLGTGGGGWAAARTGGKAGHANQGVTALALLAFLADGHVWVPLEGGKVSAHGEVVKKGIHWLVYSQQPDGLLAAKKDNKLNYSHAMATMALTEALAMSGDGRLQESAEKAVKLIIDGQRPNGGWNYTNEPGSERADTSVTGWQVMALVSARRAGLKVPEATLKGAMRWFDSVTDGRTAMTGYEKRPGSTRGTSRQYHSTTAISLLCRLASGLPQERKLLLRQASIIAARPPQWGTNWRPDTCAKRVDLYYWYHATEAMFLLGGSHWEKRWNPDLKTALVATQNPAQGYWPAHTLWGEQGGTVYTTSLAVLCLTTYYRYP